MMHVSSGSIKYYCIRLIDASQHYMITRLVVLPVPTYRYPRTPLL